MIVRISRAGASFKGLGTYLTHDPKADTANRVAWTHTLNLANDHVLSAIHEMYTLHRDADLIKEENGVRPGGRTVEKPVKHYSLNWHPSETLTREQMIVAAEGFMQHMAIHDHQALLVAHTDKEHPHVHLMVNAIGPDGLKMSESHEKRRAQAWALEYEREQGRIFCEERLKDTNERDAGMPREAWLAMKEAEAEHARHEQARRTFDSGYMAKEDNAAVIRKEEWGLLKEHQRKERETFFADGKEAYADVRREVYQEVRQNFREEWTDYYAAKRENGDSEALREQRGDILERQNEALREARDAAASALRLERDQEYRELLDQQKEQRQELRDRQAEGLSSPHLLDLAYPAPPEEGRGEAEARPGAAEFRAAAEETTDRIDARREVEPEREEETLSPTGPTGVRDGMDGAVSIGIGAIGGIASIAERLFDGFFGGGETVVRPPPPPRSEPEFKPENPFAKAAVEAHRVAEEEEQARSRAYWEGRDRGRE